MADEQALLQANDGPEEVLPEEIGNKNYKIRNLLAFVSTGFFGVAFVVFLTSSQPFYINQVLKIKNRNIGRIIGTLGVVDEITCIISAPLLGSLNDKLDHWVIKGSSLLVFTGFVSICISFLLYGIIPFDSWIQLVIPRILFATGVTSTMSMIPVLLNQIVYSDFKFSSILFWREAHASTVSNKAKNGRYSSLIGVATGLGAIFSVSFFLTLPVRLLTDLDVPTRDGIRPAFVLIGLLSLGVSIVLILFLYRPPPNSETLTGKKLPPYLTLMAQGLHQFKVNPSVRLACVGGFVARPTSVIIAVFVPLFVNNFYYKSGLCDADGSPAKVNCYEGYTFAAILTGVAQTMGLLSAPFWGILIDKFGQTHTLLLSSLFGLIGNGALCLLNVFDPRNATTFILVSFIGVSQLGTILTSMSYISEQSEVVGSISGIYNLCGGVGILVLSQFGGQWSDKWILTPFLLMSVFHIVLIATAVHTKSKIRI